MCAHNILFLAIWCSCVAVDAVVSRVGDGGHSAIVYRETSATRTPVKQVTDEKGLIRITGGSRETSVFAVQVCEPAHDPPCDIVWMKTTSTVQSSEDASKGLQASKPVVFDVVRHDGRWLVLFSFDSQVSVDVVETVDGRWQTVTTHRLFQQSDSGFSPWLVRIAKFVNVDDALYIDFSITGNSLQKEIWTITRDAAVKVTDEAKLEAIRTSQAKQTAPSAEPEPKDAKE